MVLTLFDGTERSDLHISTMHEKSCRGVFAFSTEKTNQIWPRAKVIRSSKGNGMTWTSFFANKLLREVKWSKVSGGSVVCPYNTTTLILSLPLTLPIFFLIFT